MPHIYAWKQLYGKNFLIWLGPQVQLAVTEHELFKEILNNKDGAYLKGKVDALWKKLLGDGIVVAEGEKWTKLRKIANHAFYGESLKGMIPEMIASVETTLERWSQHEGNEIEMTMIWNEALRLYGPVVSTLRRVEKETKLGNLTIPANTDIQLPLLALHHDPEIWGQDYHLFKPERFAGVAKATNNKITGFIPFGFSPRICVGLHFATNEVKIALSMILQRYKFTLSSNYVHSPFLMFTLQLQNGIQIIFNKL